MASKCGSSRPWIWAIEALASNQVESSVLIDVLKNYPGEIDEKNVREIASLRILESLSVLEKGKIGDVSPLDFSQSDGCEDVLRQLFLKSSGSNHTSIEADTLNSDLKPFIQSKRTCLPTCALKQLKDVILKDTYLVPTSVKERSELQIKNRIPEGTDLDASQDSHVRDLSTAERVINESVPANQGGLSTCNQLIVYNPFDPFANAVTKLKQNAFCTEKAKGNISASSRNAEDNFGGTVHHTAIDGSDLCKEPQVETLKEVISSENDYCDCVASKRLKTSSTIDDADLLHHHQQQAAHDVENINQAMSEEEQGINMGAERTKNDGEDSDELRTLGSSLQAVTQKTTYVDGGKEKCERSFPQIAPSSVCSGKDKASMEHDDEPEILCDDDVCLDNNGTIIIKRNTYINSQCTYSQDSLATADGTKRLLCMICKRGDQLLVCSSDFCPRVVHESCLGVEPTFDARGSFFCPFCSYSQAISEYVASKKKTSLARKALVAFICRDEYRLRHSSNMSLRTDQNQSRELDGLDKYIEQSSGVNVVNRDKKTQSKKISNDVASVSRASPYGEKGRTVSDERNDIVSENRETGRAVNGGINVASEDMEKANCGSSACCQSPIEQEKRVLVENKKRKKESQAVEDCEVHYSNSKDVNMAHASKQHAATERKQDDFCLQVVLPFELAKPLDSVVEKKPTEENDKSMTCYNSLRVRKRQPEYTYPAIPQLRRKIIPWTDAEEEALKEGVKRFASHNERMPWKEILEFGGEIFDKGRTTVDLKDKWRNLCKKSPKSIK